MKPDHVTDEDEYRRLIAQDEADDPTDLWRVERRRPTPEPIGEFRIDPELPKRHRLIQPRVGSDIPPPRFCVCCHRRREACICDPDHQEF